MHDFKTGTRLKWWPSLQDYNEAVQIPQASLLDPELRNGLPYTTPLGLPRPISGAFASVYRMHCDGVDYALRLFLKNIDDQAERYALISDFVQNDSLAYTVTFDFLQKGIKVRSDWFPALKMEWVEGIPFEEYIVANLKNPTVLAELSDSFLHMMNELRAAGVAHGDLQHGNIIMCGNEIRLVDYDGMYVPAMKNFSACEIGHPNYQHPARTALHFGPYLDNFSAWIIYASIKALEIEPSLLNQLGGGDDCLLFRRSDFLEPLQSPVFAALERHDHKLLQSLGRFIRAQLSCSVQNIPHLALTVPDGTVPSEPIPDAVSPFRDGPRLVHGNVADWAQESNLLALTKSEEARSQLVEGRAISIHPQHVQAQNANASPWIKPVNSTQYATSVNGSRSADAASLSIPPELAASAPRAVALAKNSRFTSPVFKQWLMLFCPLVWMMVYQFFAACTIDLELKNHGRPYDATIFKVDHSQTHSKSGTKEHVDVSAAYKVNGRTYRIVEDMGRDFRIFKEGDVYPVVALPKDPTVHEDFTRDAGARYQADLDAAWFLVLANTFLEAWIWFVPFRHKILASSGKPVVGTVRNLFSNLSGGTYIASVSYVVDSTTYRTDIPVSRAESAQLKIGTQEILLCEPNNFKFPIFYRFCLYHALLSSNAQAKHP